MAQIPTEGIYIPADSGRGSTPLDWKAWGTALKKAPRLMKAGSGYRVQGFVYNRAKHFCHDTVAISRN